MPISNPNAQPQPSTDLYGFGGVKYAGDIQRVVEMVLPSGWEPSIFNFHQ